jgi:ubiquinone/menaquinone biosynthesis C-methylase UbiE
MPIEKQYNEFHAVYSENLEQQDEIGNRMFYKHLNFLLEGKQVLDVGCGDGTDCANYKKMGANVFGVDPSENFIGSAKEKLPEGNFIVGRGEILPFSDEEMDVVFSKYALQTSPDVPKILQEISRVLKPEGMLVYLAKAPIRQFIEKKKEGKNYFEQEVVDSYIYEGKIHLREPSHTLGEYLNPDFLKDFEIENFEEGFDFPASEQVNGDIYPTFFIVKAKKKPKT